VPSGAPPSLGSFAQSELDRLQRIPLLIVHEVGYILFDPHAAILTFMLVSRYERASMIVTSNKPFSGWGIRWPTFRPALTNRRFGRAEIHY
jgi:DNA replication protein DnaC